MDAHSRRSRVRVRCHDSDHTTSPSIQPGSDYTQNDILAGKNTSNPRFGAEAGRRRSRSLHNTNRSRPPLLHNFCNFPHRGFWSNRSRLCVCVHDGSQIWQRGLLPELFSPREHGCSLRIRSHCTEFRLYTSHRTKQLFRSGRAAFNLSKCFVEDFGDIEKANNIPLFITDGLKKKRR